MTTPLPPDALTSGAGLVPAAEECDDIQTARELLGGRAFRQ